MMLSMWQIFASNRGSTRVLRTQIPRTVVGQPAAPEAIQPVAATPAAIQPQTLGGVGRVFSFLNEVQHVADPCLKQRQCIENLDS